MSGRTGALAVTLVVVIGGVNAARSQQNDFNDGCISVVIDDGSQKIVPNGGFAHTTAAKRFYQTHGDDYEFLLFFPNFDFAAGSAYQGAFNDIAGIGLGDLDQRGLYGVSRLEGSARFANFTTFPENPEDRVPDNVRMDCGGVNNDSTLSLIAQEFGHRWAAFVRHAPGDNSLLGRNSQHWSYYFATPSTGPRGGASSLEGNRWVDNGNGTFTSVAQTDGYSELDQYLMGLRAASAVSPFYFIRNFSGGLGQPAEGCPKIGDTVQGTRMNVTIDDIVATNGVRVPSAAAAPKSFRQAFVLVAPEGSQRQDLAGDIARLDEIRTAWAEYFAEETDLLGSVETCVLRRPVDIVFLVDISLSFSDDLPILKANAGELVDSVLQVAPDSRFALASFSDFPFNDFGSEDAGDIAYRLDLPMSGRAEFLAAIDALETLDAKDFPQSQYEALYQVLTGAGRDLDGDGSFTDLGEIEPSNLGADSARPLFIFLFTDAPFHDPDLEPDYPLPGVDTAGRSDVIALLSNTPFVFGLASGDDTQQLQELADLTGGAVFDVDPNSAGFEAAVLSAVETTQPPPSPTLTLLEALELGRIEVNWNLADTGTEGLAAVFVDGTVTLPENVAFAQIAPRARLAVQLAQQPVIDLDLALRKSGSRGALWQTPGGPSQGFELKVAWISPREGRISFTGRFDPRRSSIHGESEPLELVFVLGLGRPLLTQEASVLEGQWDRSDPTHWRRRNPRP